MEAKGVPSVVEPERLGSSDLVIADMVKPPATANSAIQGSPPKATVAPRGSEGASESDRLRNSLQACRSKQASRLTTPRVEYFDGDGGGCRLNGGWSLSWPLKPVGTNNDYARRHGVEAHVERQLRRPISALLIARWVLEAARTQPGRRCMWHLAFRSPA